MTCVYRVDIRMDRHTVIHMWSRWTCKSFLEILEPEWLEYLKYYPFGFLLIYPPFDKTFQYQQNTNQPSIDHSLRPCRWPPFCSVGWFLAAAMVATNDVGGGPKNAGGLPPFLMRVIKVVPMICGNYMKVLWKMIPVDYGPMVSRSASVQGFAMLQYCPFCGSLTLDISNQSTCCWQPKVHQLICGFIWM